MSTSIYSRASHYNLNKGALISEIARAVSGPMTSFVTINKQVDYMVMFTRKLLIFLSISQLYPVILKEIPKNLWRI